MVFRRPISCKEFCGPSVKCHVFFRLLFTKRCKRLKGTGKFDSIDLFKAFVYIWSLDIIFLFSKETCFTYTRATFNEKPYKKETIAMAGFLSQYELWTSICVQFKFRPMFGIGHLVGWDMHKFINYIIIRNTKCYINML